MSDNVSNASVSTDVIGADDVSGVKYQRIKVVTGSDGVVDGDVSKSNPMPIEANSTISSDLVDQAVLASAMFTSPASQLSGISYRNILKVAATVIGTIKITIQVSLDNVIWDTLYQNRYGYSSGNSTINLPSLSVTGKFIRYLISSSSDISVSIIRGSLATNTKELRQLLIDNTPFSSVSDVTPALNTSKLKILTATVSAITNGYVKYKWELSVDGVDWFNGSSTQKSDSARSTHLLAQNYGYSFGRLVVVDSTSNSNINTICLQGLG